MKDQNDNPARFYFILYTILAVALGLLYVGMVVFIIATVNEKGSVENIIAWLEEYESGFSKGGVRNSRGTTYLFFILMFIFLEIIFIGRARKYYGNIPSGDNAE